MATELGEEALDYWEYSTKGKYAGMTDEQRSKHQEFLISEYNRVMSRIEAVRSDYVVNALGAEATATQAFTAWASAYMRGVEIADAGASRALDIFKENVIVDPMERAVYYGDAEQNPGWNADPKGGKSIRSSIDVLTAEMSPDTLKKNPDQLGVALITAGKLVPITIAEINKQFLTPAGRELGHRKMAQIVRNNLRESLEIALGGTEHTSKIDQTVNDFTLKYLPTFQTEYGPSEEWYDLNEKQQRADDAYREATKILGPSHAITLEYNKLKQKHGGLTISPKSLSKEGAAIDIPETLKDSRDRLRRQMEEADAGSETLPSVLRVMQLPGFMALVKTLGYKHTVEDSRKVLRYIGNYPEQSSRIMNLHNKLVRDPNFKDRGDLRGLMLRFYLENQVDAGDMKHQLFRTKEGVRKYNTNLARRYGLTDVAIGRLKQGVQSYVDSNGTELVVPKLTEQEAMAGLAKHLEGTETGPETNAKVIAWLQDNMKSLSPEATATLVDSYAPALIKGAEKRDKDERDRIESSSFDSSNTTDLLSEDAPPIDQATFGHAFDIKETDADIARSVKAQQAMVDAMGPPLTQGKGLPPLEYRELLAQAALQDSELGDPARVDKLTRTGYLGTDPKPPAPPTPPPAAAPVVVDEPPPPAAGVNPLDDLIGYGSTPKPKTKTKPVDIATSKNGSTNPLDALIGF